MALQSGPSEQVCAFAGIKLGAIAYDLLQLTPETQL